MAPRDKSRFCGECKKVVHDLRSMKEKDAKALLSAPSTEGLCVRYMYDEHGNVWFADSFFMRTEGLLKKVAAAAAVASAPFLTACMGAYAGPIDGVAETQEDAGTNGNGDPGYPIPQADGGAGAKADAALPSDQPDAAPSTDDGAAPDPDAAVDPDPNADAAVAPDPNVDPDPNADADAGAPYPNPDADAGIDPGPNADDAGAPAADDAGLPPHCRDRRGHRVRHCDPDGGPRRRH